MRMIRALTIATAVVAALPMIATAQQGRQFKDAWFWGVKAGGFTLADSSQDYRQSALVGVDWLITRTHGGLYVSGGEAFFHQQTLVPRDPASLDSGFRAVDLKNMRKLDVAVMGFPGEHLLFHPYAGVGFTLSQVATADPQPPFANADQLNSAEDAIQQKKVGFSPLFIVGGQYRLHWASVFGQFSFSPAQQNFILYNGRPWNFAYEIGLRYNVGTSIDRS